MMDHKEYFDKLRNDFLHHTFTNEFLNIPSDVMDKYFNGHIDRFIWTLKIFDQYFKDEKIEKVLDVGTATPFASYYLTLTKGSHLYFGCPLGKDFNYSENIRFRNFNLNYYTDFPKHDLVICTECLEHLPSNMYKACENLDAALNDGGYMILSFPLGGKNAKDYEAEELGNYNVAYDHHFREFTVESAFQFLKTAFLNKGNYEMLRNDIFYVKEYGNDIMHVLLKKVGTK